MSAFRRTRSVSSPALQRLLDDAAAPAHADELDGLAAALTAFAQAPTPRRTPMKSALAALLSAKALAVAASATAVGGIALAASTGTLPGSVSPHATPGTPSPHASGRPSAHASASPSPSQVGLCRAYLAGVKEAKGKALDNPAFSTLTAAAGSAQAVDAYCARVLASAPGGRPTELPSPAREHPTGKPSTHPTGKPADVPPAHAKGKPADVPPPHPTAPPTTHPTGP